MAYNYEYPYVDTGRANADWLINKVKELEQSIIGIQDEIFDRSKGYIDEQMQPYVNAVNQLRNDFINFKNSVNADIQSFENIVNGRMSTYETRVNATLQIFTNRINDLQSEIRNSIIGVNARTDLRIEQNNDYIFTVLTPRALERVKVLNFFTGERISVQDMFDYLASFHAQGSARIEDFETAEKTVAEIVAINEKCTNWVLLGKSYLGIGG